LTVTHGNIHNGEIYIKNGKIAAVGVNLPTPVTAELIDAEALALGRD
jgi:imidazolonepropionase-like amidohydrolase